MDIPNACPECESDKSQFTWDGAPRSKDQGLATRVIDMWLGCDQCSATIISGLTLDDFLEEMNLWKIGCI